MQAESLQKKLERVFAEQRRTLVGMLARIVGNPATAEELAHEAYLRVSVVVTADGAIASPQAFLFRTARNLAIDHVRRGNMERRIFDQGADDATIETVAGLTPTPEDFARHRQSLLILDAALASVSGRARRVLILNRLHGWTFEHIAEHLGVSTTTVYKDFRRAMAVCMDAAKKDDLL
ncbi:MAG: RNA polymerase sigma factor [Rhodospirillales bacterium]